MANPINQVYMPTNDLLARLTCVEAAGKICASQPEYNAAEVAKSLYDFVMEGATDTFKKTVFESRTKDPYTRQ